MVSARSPKALLILLVMIAVIFLVPAHGFASDAIVTPLDASGNPIGDPIHVTGNNPVTIGAPDYFTAVQLESIRDLIILFIISFGFTVYLCIRGDDDVVYKYLDRKPTSAEAIARVRFVLAKLFASLIGGGLITLYLAIVLKRLFSFSFVLSSVGENLIILLSTFIGTLLIGALQNLIRLVQSRRTRPIIDTMIIKHNFNQWLSLIRRS